MAKKSRLQSDSEEERIPEAAGLVITQPPVVDEDESAQVDASVDSDAQPSEPVADVEDEQAFAASTTAPSDPSATIAACLLGVGRTYNEMADLSKALSKFLPKVAGEPELHGFLMRVHGVCGDFRHAIDQAEQAMSDRLRDAIAQAVSA